MASEAAVAAIHAFAEDGFNAWKVGASEAQRAAALAEMEKYTTDPNFAAIEMAKVQAAFGVADLDDDGLLTEAEFASFDAATNSDSAAKGHWVDLRPEARTANFNALNLINTEENGVSFTAWATGMGIMVAKYQELKAEARL